MLKIESSQTVFAGEFRAGFAPMQSPADHQVQNEPQFVLKTESNPLSHPPQGRDRPPVDAGEGWRHCPQQKRTRNANSAQSLAEHPALQRLKIDGDVRQLRHSRQLTMSQAPLNLFSPWAFHWL